MPSRLVFILAAASCATPGPKDLPVVRLGYNEVIARLLQVLYSAVSATSASGPVLTIPVGQ